MMGRQLDLFAPAPTEPKRAVLPAKYDSRSWARMRRHRKRDDDRRLVVCPNCGESIPVEP